MIRSTIHLDRGARADAISSDGANERSLFFRRATRAERRRTRGDAGGKGLSTLNISSNWPHDGTSPKHGWRPASGRRADRPRNFIDAICGGAGRSFLRPEHARSAAAACCTCCCSSGERPRTCSMYVRRGRCGLVWQRNAGSEAGVEWRSQPSQSRAWVWRSVKSFGCVMAGAAAVRTGVAALEEADENVDRVAVEGLLALGGQPHADDLVGEDAGERPPPLSHL